MIAGHATAEATARYAASHAERTAPGHFREFPGGARASSLGLGTYLGREDAATDALYEKAIARALERGLNVLDAAINYRHQRSERAIGRALAASIARGTVAREDVVVTTKGGYLAFDGEAPPDPRAYFAATYVQPGIIRPGDVVGWHCITPRFLADQLERSRANLGLETLDVYYVHNPETQLDEVERPEFLSRLRAAFGALEEAVRARKIRWYGTATWNGYRVPPQERGHLSLAEVLEAARGHRRPARAPVRALHAGRRHRARRHEGRRPRRGERGGGGDAARAVGAIPAAVHGGVTLRTPAVSGTVVR